jgi:nicotinate-nucleotide adenylyltransferase
MRIGLFGGSFNPVHAGHQLVVLEAMRRLALDSVWVLVTPGNPLKDKRELAPLEQRVEAARAVFAHPQIRVSGFEAAHGFTYSWQTLQFLTQSLPDRHFVWIMGADNLAGFHRWERWRDIAAMVPMAIYVRPGSTRLAPLSRAGATLAPWRIREEDAQMLPLLQAPAWVYLHGQQSSLSSSAIRANQQQFSPK